MEDAAKHGVELHYVLTPKGSDFVDELKALTPGGKGFDDIFLMVAQEDMVTKSEMLLAWDGCLNFFAGPSDAKFTAPINFYNVHYNATHYVGTSGSNTQDMKDAMIHPEKHGDLLVKTGNGEVPEGYSPLTRFGEVIAYNLNHWDEDDDVNGVYFFYKQDRNVSVDSGKTYYIYDVYLQSGESDSHCIELLKAAGYTPLTCSRVRWTTRRPGLRRRGFAPARS